MSDKTKIVLEMPAEAAARLVRDFKENPEGVRDYFKQLGFDIESILPTDASVDESNAQWEREYRRSQMPENHEMGQ